MRLAPEADDGPFIHPGEAGHIRGLSVELLARVAENLGHRLASRSQASRAARAGASDRGVP